MVFKNIEACKTIIEIKIKNVKKVLIGYLDTRVSINFL
jgi:hypothetical protein